MTENHKRKAVPIDCDSFGEWLRMEKERRGLRIVDIAKMSGVSKYSIACYISQHQPPCLHSVVLLAQAFGKQVMIMDKEAKT